VLELQVVALAEQAHQGVDDGFDQGGFDGHGDRATFFTDASIAAAGLTAGDAAAGRAAVQPRLESSAGLGPLTSP
jgi:hypothetical protein